MISGLLSLVATIALTAGISGAPVQAQGKISGVARDSSGAGMPGVVIAVTSANQSAAAAQTATTNNDGTYSFTLPAGSYTLAATISGFRRVVQTATLTAAGSSQVDFTLQPVLSEEITVTAAKRE